MNLDLEGGCCLGLKRGKSRGERENERKGEIVRERREKFQELKSRIKY